MPYLETQPRNCEAFVIRRGFDGTATVEIPQANGEPVASDWPDPLTASRRGDVTIVKLGADERYDVPDILVSGG